MSYQPTYTWPNAAFPFRVYFNNKKLRIFIIENIQHNWLWLSKHHKSFRDNDYFFVYCGWYHSNWFAKQSEQIFSELELKKENFYFMFNSYKEKENFENYGFKGDIINQNCWLDENLVMKPLNENKLYNAIYVGRFSAFKRHYLASKVNNLALVAGINHGNKIIDSIPNHTYLNDTQLTPDEVCKKINQSHCGLILSAEEGACFASSEYLLCGIPVVSTKENGGRSIWYDDYNSIICEDCEDAVSDAVKFFKKTTRNKEKIRETHILRSNLYRSRFILKFSELLLNHDVIGINSFKYFEENFIHKLRKSHRPEFDKIFREYD